MPQRVLRFDNSKYLLLNIIAHDVIHDFGNADSDRWQKVQKILQDFYAEKITGGTKSITITQSLNIPREKMGKSNIAKQSEKFPGKSNKVGTIKDRLDEYNIKPALQSFINDIENEIMMGFFHMYLTSRINAKESEIKNKKKSRSNRSRKITKKSRSGSRSRSRSSRKRNYYYNVSDYVDFIKYIPSILKKESDTINYIYSDISDLFYIFLKDGLDNETMENNVKSPNDIEKLWKFLNKFFKDKQELIKTVIYSYTEYNKKRKRNMSFSAGAKPQDKMSGDDAIKLFNNVKDNIVPGSSAHRIIQEMDQLYLEMVKNELDNKQRNVNEDRIKYNENRQKLINELTEIYKDNKGDKYAKSLDQINIIGQRIPRKYDVTEHITRIINLSIEVPRKIAEKKIKEDNDRMLKIQEDIRRAQSGHLTSEDKTLVGNFMKLIAKMGLLLTGCVNSDYTINWTNDSTLNTQVDALLYIADIPGGTVRSKDIDNILINYYDANSNVYPKYAYKGNEYIVDERLKCNGQPKYIINNAAPIGSLSNSAFCPYTSIIDGMSQCSWNTAQTDGIEYGNIDFKITDIANNENSLYYNGFLNISEGSRVINNYQSQIDLGFSVNFPGFGKVNGKKLSINMANADDLEASIVLRNTLLGILLSIPNLKLENIWDEIYTRLMEEIDNPQYPIGAQKIPIFELIYREILFKGVGDLFQEINAVAKYGGYIMDNSYICDSTIINSYQGTDGNQIRGFLANDRPSGTRFIYMLLNGAEDEINNKAFGGYYSKEKEVLAKRSDNTNICKK